MISITTTAQRVATDITAEVERLAAGQGSGALLLTCPHTSAALFLCEADDELLRDFSRFSATWLEGMEPFEHTRNDNPNAAAHITSAVMGGQVLIPLTEGRLSLGTYQRIVLLELDGPKTRTVNGHLLGSVRPIVGGER